MGSTICLEDRNNNNLPELFGIKSTFNNNKQIVIKFESSQMFRKNYKKKRRKRKKIVL